MHEKYLKFRAEYPEFIYKGFEKEKKNGRLCVRYHFSVPGLADFYPDLDFPLEAPHDLNPPDSAAADEILFSIGMVELISYWKIACPPEVIIENHPLSEEQKKWWKALYFGGLGEFFYRNGIEVNKEDFMQITCRGDAGPVNRTFSFRSSGKNMIPVGGGKDSIVTIEHMAALKEKNMLFAINPSGAAKDTMRIAGYPETQRSIVGRRLDPEMLRLNSEGFLNGHTPFSALLAFVSYFCAYLCGAEYIVLSNEASANAASIPGTEINHQYSKTSEFERAFQSYCKDYLLPEIYYFSLLRPFAEIAIARSFASYPEYLPYFRSCNLGSKKNIWCNQCAKCLFVFIILSPFLPQDDAAVYFGRNLWEAEDLEEDFLRLSGAVEVKPFECVGTVEEVQYALYLELLRRFKEISEAKDLPYLLNLAFELARAGRLQHLKFNESEAKLSFDAGYDPLVTWHTEESLPESFKPLVADIVAEGERYA